MQANYSAVKYQWRAGLLGGILLLTGLTNFGQEKPQPGNDKPKPDPQYPSVSLRNTVEDFSTITLDKSQLVPLKPVTGSLINKDSFTEERIQVQWRDVDPFDLYVIKPKGVDRPPVILYLYGYPTGVDAFHNEGWCNRVTSGGYAAVAFVGALTGDRYQYRPMRDTFLNQLQESIGTTVHDVQMVINYLETRNDLDTARIGVLGTGSGATVAILAAAADPRIKALDLMEPWGDWPVWLANSVYVPGPERKDYLKPEFLAKVAPLDSVKWLPTLTTQKVFLQFVDTDDVPAKQASAAIEAAAPKNAEVFHYINHAQHMGLSSNGRRFEWLKAQLRPPAPTSTTAKANK